MECQQAGGVVRAQLAALHQYIAVIAGSTRSYQYVPILLTGMK